MSRCLGDAARAFIAILVLGSQAQARWANSADATSVTNYEHSRYTIGRNGSYSVVVERQVEILKDQARADQGLYRSTFNPLAGRLEVLTAKTVNSKKTILVKRADIEIKPLASSGPGFDTQSQLTIAFPEVNVGSKLYLKYKLTVTKPSVPGLYSTVYTLGWNEFMQSYSAIYKSEVPLHFEVWDPDHAIETRETGHRLEINLKKPLYRAILEEENALASSESITWIGISTAASFKDLPADTIRAYADAMAAELPAKYSAILNEAKLQKTDTEQINSVTAQLAETVRYVGDFRQVKGAFHPRKTATIAENAYGDCKDFTVSAGAILKRLGFEVNAAWVARGHDWIVSPLKIAAPDINHAILYAEKAGASYWIDPTNFISFAQGIYNDIADRPAIILHPDGAYIKKIPAMQATGAGAETDLDLRFEDQSKAADPGTLEGRGKFSLTGRAAVAMTGSDLTYGKQNNDYALISWINGANTANLRSWHLAPYELRSRVVKDLSFNFTYLESWHSVLSTAGRAYVLAASPYVNLFRLRLEERAGSLKTDDPLVWKRTTRITGRQIDLGPNFKCSGTSVWVDYSRAMSSHGNDLEVNDEIILKTSVVPVVELKSDSFAHTQNSLIECMSDTVIVFKAKRH